MPLFTIAEIVDMILMTAIVGYIFSDMLRKPATRDYDPLKEYGTSLNLQNFWFAASVTVPAILFHELGHKFLALSFGMSATFKAAYMFLLIGLVLKMMNFPLIFVVPAYVSILGSGTLLQHALIAFAGPGVNLFLWLAAKIIAEKKLISKRHLPFVLLTSKINMFLFIFNMLPIPGFDGNTVLLGLFRYFF